MMMVKFYVMELIIEEVCDLRSPWRRLADSLRLMLQRAADCCGISSDRAEEKSDADFQSVMRRYSGLISGICLAYAPSRRISRT